MEIVIVMLMVVAAIVIVVFPLLVMRRYEYAGLPRTGLAQFRDLYGERDQVMNALRDAEVAHATGRLPDGAYAMLHSGYAAKATTVLGQLEALHASAVELESEHSDEFSAPHSLPTSRLTTLCPNCRAAVKLGDRFCIECGARLQ